MRIGGAAPTQVTFQGVGRGHGVGLCQFGTKYLAEQEGRGYQDILQYYYSSATLVRLWGASQP